jgi:hypothetical protein
MVFRCLTYSLLAEADCPLLADAAEKVLRNRVNVIPTRNAGPSSLMAL